MLPTFLAMGLRRLRLLAMSFTKISTISPMDRVPKKFRERQEFEDDGLVGIIQWNFYPCSWCSDCQVQFRPMLYILPSLLLDTKRGAKQVSKYSHGLDATANFSLSMWTLRRNAALISKDRLWNCMSDFNEHCRLPGLCEVELAFLEDFWNVNWAISINCTMTFS